MKRKEFLFPWLGLLLVTVGCRSSLELSSAWTESPLNIDGSRSDWSNLTIVKSPRGFVGARNDAENLYLCFATDDPGIQTQILFAGFTVWFPGTPEGAKAFGIQFPLRQDRPVRGEDRGRFEALFQAFEPRLNSLLILEGSDREQFSVFQAPGIRVRVGMAGEMLVYELQVPLKNAPGIPHAAVPTAEETVEVLFETAPSDRDEFGQEPPASDHPSRTSGRSGPEQPRLRAVIHLAHPVSP